MIDQILRDFIESTVKHSDSVIKRLDATDQALELLEARLNVLNVNMATLHQKLRDTNDTLDSLLTDGAIENKGKPDAQLP